MDHFERFWSIYPRKVAKGQAKKTWTKLIKGMPETEEKDFADLLVGAVDAQKRARQEQDRTGQFVPPWKHPTTWLNGECWNDEIKSIQEIREEVGNTANCQECGKSGPYRDRGWIVREEGTFCSPCYAKKYENGPTGMERLREAGRLQIQKAPRLAGESWGQYFHRVHGSPKNYGVGVDSREIPQSRQTPDDPLDGAWSDEKCRSEVA